MASLAAEAALERGVVLGELQRADDARAAFRRALAWAPDLGLTERHARPDVVRAFKEVAREPRRAPPDPPPVDDPLEPRLEALRAAPSADGVAALYAALDVDAVIVVVASADGRALGTRVERGCATAPVELRLDEGAGAASALLGGPCAAPFGVPVALDDPRLRPPSSAIAAPTIRARRRGARVWPWAFAGALGVTAAVVGVVVAFVAADPRYAVHVDGRAFGAAP